MQEIPNNRNPDSTKHSKHFEIEQCRTRHMAIRYSAWHSREAKCLYYRRPYRIRHIGSGLPALRPSKSLAEPKIEPEVVCVGFNHIANG